MRAGTNHLFPSAFAGLAVVVAAAGCRPPADDPRTVLRPREGEAIVAGTNQPIRWEPGDDPAATIDLRLVADDGTTTPVASAVPDDGDFTWTVPLLHSATGTYTLELGPALGSASSPLASRECPLLLQGVQGGVASGSRSLSAGAFAAVRWNESTSQEEYYWIDVHTGATTVLGTVGDLAVIPYGHPVAVDNRRGRLYVVGAPESSGSPAWTLYTLDTHSGALVRKAPLQGTPAASYIAANGAGEILGLRWNDGTSDEEVVRIDPHTGAQTLLGTVGDLLVWSGQLAVDEAHDRLYVVGSPVMGASTWKLYALSATTGELLSSPALTLGGAPLDQLLGLAANSEGALFGFRWNGTKEEMLSVDPATGVATVVGTVGDLAVWSTTSALNPTSDTLYVVGNDGASDELYVMDARTATGGTDRFLYSTSIAKYPTAGVLVYRGRPRPTN